MGSGYFAQPAAFLIQVLFGLYILTVMLRFLFQLVRADFYNPLSQALVTITNPALRPLRRIIPGIRGVDVPSIVLMLTLQILELWLISLVIGDSPKVVGLIVLALAELLQLALYVFMGAILIQVIISWVSPGAYNPMTQLLYSLSAPVLKPAKALIPPLGGLDFSPFVALVALQLFRMMVIGPIFMAARQLL
jgi:YggT family protein